MAVGILRRLLEEKESREIEVESAGIAAYAGSPATLFAVDTCRNFGLDISQHTARQITQEIAQAADLILVMAPEHLDYISNLNRSLLEKTFLLKAFPGQGEKGRNYTIKDPIGGDQQAYLSCFFDLDENLHRILPALLNLAEKK
jgi:protein-tyrosine phosphatase